MYGRLPPFVVMVDFVVGHAGVSCLSLSDSVDGGGGGACVYSDDVIVSEVDEVARYGCEGCAAGDEYYGDVSAVVCASE